MSDERALAIGIIYFIPISLVISLMVALIRGRFVPPTYPSLKLVSLFTIPWVVGMITRDLANHGYLISSYVAPSAAFSLLTSLGPNFVSWIEGKEESKPQWRMVESAEYRAVNHSQAISMRSPVGLRKP